MGQGTAPREPEAQVSRPGREGGVGQEEKGPSAEAVTPPQAAEVPTCAAEGLGAAQVLRRAV